MNATNWSKPLENRDQTTTAKVNLQAIARQLVKERKYTSETSNSQDRSWILRIISKAIGSISYQVTLGNCEIICRRH